MAQAAQIDAYGNEIPEGGYAPISDVPLRLSHLGNAIASMPITLATGDTQLPGLARYIPFTGAAESAAGMVGGLANYGAQIGNAILNEPGTPSSKWGLTIPNAPAWMTKAGEHFEQNRQEVQGSISKYTGGVLAKPDLTTPEGQETDVVGSLIGGGIGFTPGSVINALPRGLKTVGAILAPSFEHMPTTVPLTTAAGTVQDIGMDVAQQQQQPTPTPTPTPPTVATTSTTEKPTQLADPNSQLFGTTAPAPPRNPNAALFGVTPPATPSGDPNAALFGTTPAGPTFTQQGNTGMPLWEAGLGLITTLGLLHAGRLTHTLGTDVSAATRDARFRDPTYAAQVQAYNNDVISRGPNSGTLLPPNGVPVPAPSPRGSLADRAITGVSGALTNEAAPIQNYINLTSSDPSMAERLSAMAGNMHDPQYQQNKTENFLLTGHDPVTGITLPSVTDLLNDRANLPQAKSDVLAQGLRAANEINTRDWNTTKWNKTNPGVAPSLDDIAHDFFGKGTDELHGYVAAMQADPQLAEMQNRYNKITAGMPIIGEHPNWGFFTPQEANDLRTIRPDYVPEMDVNGKTMHPFGERDTSAFTGQAQIMTDPIRDLAQHVAELYPQFERNRFKQEMMNHQMNTVQRVPGAAQSMVDVQAPTGAHASYYPVGGLSETGGQARDPITSVRTASGIRYLRDDNPITRTAMNASSSGSQRVVLGAANTARRIFQQFTTGVGSAATGRIIPLHTAIATGIAAPFSAKPNMRAGMFDYALQRMSRGGRANPVLQSAARGLDLIANPLGTAYRYAKGFDERNYGRFASLFERGANNPANNMLRATAGDAVVDSLHKMANDRWQASTEKWIREQGMKGAGSPIHMDAPGIVTGTQATRMGEQPAGIRSLGANLAPKAYFSSDWAKGNKPFFINLRNAVGEFLGHISDAGLDQVAALNRNNPNISPEALAYNVRGLYGNPSRKGGSVAVQKATSVLPWANVAMQEIGAVGAGVGRNPFGAALTGTVGLGGLALLTILTHMRSQAHMDFLQNQISTQQRESNVILATNSDPNKPTEIFLPRAVRVPYAFMLDVMSKVVNLVAARHDPVTFNGVWEGLKDFFSNHITTSDAMAMQHAGIDMGDFINLPPYMGHVDYNAALQNGLANLPSAFHGSWSGPTDKQLPGQTPATPMDAKTGEVFRNILSNTLGAAVGTLYDTPATIARYMHEGHGFLDSVGMTGRDWLQGAREGNLSANNLLFETPIRLSKQPPIAEALQPTLLALKNLPPEPTLGGPGFTSNRNAGRLPVPVGGEAPVSSDMLMQQMLASARSYGTRIDAAMVPINAIKQQMGAVDKMGMDPQAKREWLNQSTRNMADRYKLVQAYTSDMYHTLSQFAGRPITNLSQIDWQKDHTQFAR